jgi:hypothetical protein
MDTLYTIFGVLILVAAFAIYPAAIWYIVWDSERRRADELHRWAVIFVTVATGPGGLLWWLLTRPEVVEPDSRDR